MSITIPNTPGCEAREYTATLAGDAEHNGEHIAVINFPPFIGGKVLDYGETVWRPLQWTESFFFSEIGETYLLKLWTSVTDGDDLKIPYVVKAVYAPEWAWVTKVLRATPYEETCCDASAYAPTIFETVSLGGFSSGFLGSGTCGVFSACISPDVEWPGGVISGGVIVDTVPPHVSDLFACTPITLPFDFACSAGASQGNFDMTMPGLITKPKDSVTIRVATGPITWKSGSAHITTDESASNSCYVDRDIIGLGASTKIRVGSAATTSIYDVGGYKTITGTLGISVALRYNT